MFREVAASLYAWDLADEGTEAVLETLKETALVNSVYLVALMHHERRTYFPEDSRTYWRPHARFYEGSRITPLATERAEFCDKDWVGDETMKKKRRFLLHLGAR